MLVKKYGWAIQKSLFTETNEDSTFSHTRENSKMLNITSKYFGFFNNKPPATSLAHIAREILTCYSCLYYSSCTFLSACLFIYVFIFRRINLTSKKCKQQARDLNLLTLNNLVKLALMIQLCCENLPIYCIERVFCHGIYVC